MAAEIDLYALFYTRRLTQSTLYQLPGTTLVNKSRLLFEIRALILFTN